MWDQGPWHPTDPEERRGAGSSSVRQESDQPVSLCSDLWLSSLVEGDLQRGAHFISCPMFTCSHGFQNTMPVIPTRVYTYAHTLCASVLALTGQWCFPASLCFLPFLQGNKPLELPVQRPRPQPLKAPRGPVISPLTLCHLWLLPESRAVLWLRGWEGVQLLFPSLTFCVPC